MNGDTSTTTAPDRKRTSTRSRAVTAALVVAAVLGLALATVPVGGASGPAPAAATGSGDLAPGGSTVDPASASPAVDPGGGCGDSSATTHEGTITGGGERHTYPVGTADNCTLTVALSGPEDADFDLYLTIDGRQVTTDDYDRQSTDAGSAERIVLGEAVTGSASEVEILVHPYRGTGEYTLTITPDATGGPTNVAPSPSLVANATTVAPGTPVVLNASDSVDPDGSVVEYRWHLGDNETATGVSTTHNFSEPGTYTVTLTVTDDDGSSASTTETIAVESADSDPGPVDGWHSPRNPQPGETAAFVGEPLGSPVSDAEFRWDFDGDGETDATGRTATHAFGSEGRHDVTLTVDTGYGNKTYTTTVLVGSPAPDDDAGDDGSNGPGNVTAPPGEGLGDVSQPGFGPGAAVAAVSLAVFGWRIRDGH